MNKYQEALNQIKHELYAEEDDYNVSLMQELVDKATPKKPAYYKIDQEWICPYCAEEVFGGQKICSNCGKALDWNNDEPTK